MIFFSRLLIKLRNIKTKYFTVNVNGKFNLLVLHLKFI